MDVEDSDVTCPFCKTKMVRGYAILRGEGILYFSVEKKLSLKLNVLGSLIDDESEIMDGFPDKNRRVAYRCSDCKGIYIKQTPNTTPRTLDNRKDLIRHITRT